MMRMSERWTKKVTKTKNAEYKQGLVKQRNKPYVDSTWISEAEFWKLCKGKIVAKEANDDGASAM